MMIFKGSSTDIVMNSLYWRIIVLFSETEAKVVVSKVVIVGQSFQ